MSRGSRRYEGGGALAVSRIQRTSSAQFQLRRRKPSDAFYLANSVKMVPRNTDGEVYFELRLADAWVWDMYRPARFVKQVRVVTFRTTSRKSARAAPAGIAASPSHVNRLCAAVGRPWMYVEAVRWRSAACDVLADYDERAVAPRKREAAGVRAMYRCSGDAADGRAAHRGGAGSVEST